MSLIIRKVIFLVGLTLYITSAHSQTVTSTRNGAWNDPTIWSGGFVPASVNATGIIIDHEVELPSLYVVSVYNVIVNGKLTLKGSSQLTILADSQPGIRDLTIVGTLILEDLATLNGTSTANTIFTSGSEYIHRQGPLGFIPYATWDKSSTFIINGFKDSGYINIAHSDSWKQIFGNVTYDCPQQTIFVVDLNGYLRNIAGDLTIKNTNNKTVRLSTTQNPTINVGGSMLVEGPSELWFSTNGTSTIVNIQKDFKYSSSSAGPTYLTTRGVITLTIKGNLEWSSPGPLRMASSSADSLGLRKAVVNVSGNLSISNGVIIAPPLGSGSGRITFRGPGEQKVAVSATGSSFQGNLDYFIDVGSIVDLGNSVLSNTTGSLQVNGTLRVGSTDPQGAIQLVNKGNIYIPGARRYEVGSTIEYNGSAPQWVGNGHPSNASVNLAITNPTNTSLLRDVLCHNLVVSGGTLSGGLNRLTAWGNVTIDHPSTVAIKTISLEGNEDQLIDVENSIVNNLEVNKSGGQVSLNSPMKLQGFLQIESVNTSVRSDGNLKLLSTSDSGPGSACVASLPAGSRVLGDVTVQRYMEAEGRIYRYISSPVQGASVASLMDNFAVTGNFVDPTTVNVSNPKTPSLYYYDESQGSLQGGWKPYPNSGLAKDNPLLPGRGYCALIRQGAIPIVWDVTGTLNQGDIVMPVAMTSNMEPSNGWNLVGNPYACTIDWDINGPNGWTKQNISPIFCIRDNGIGSGGSVLYWDGDVNYFDIPEGHIAPGQSFWVKATGPNPQLIVREGVKVVADAEFYRTSESHIPSFALLLKKDGYVDKAYYKVRPGASSNFDLWDAIKMDNDNFDISTLSDDGLSLAINSRDGLPCGEHFVKVKVKDLKRGTYQIGIDTRFEFASYTYTWIDGYLNTEVELLPGSEIEIEITDDPASKSPDRFRLRLNEVQPTNSQNVVAPALVCSNNPIRLMVADSQAGMFYSVWESGRQLSGESMSIGGNLTLEVNFDSVEAGNHRFDVVARSACSRALLTSTAIVQVEKIEPLVVAATVCQGETANLSVLNANSTLNYFWFASESGIDTLAIGRSMTTSQLQKSQSFYVSAALPSGCSSNRKRVDVTVRIIEPAYILLKDSETLCSNYRSGNHWFSDGTLISTSNQIYVDHKGIFVLMVDTLGCTTSDTIEFVYLSVSPDLVGVDIHPNPVKDKLTLSPVNYSAQLEIVGVSGGVVMSVPQLEISSNDEAMIDVRDLTPGTYIAVVRMGQRKKIMRFVKIE